MIRIIPCLDIIGDKTVKGKKFQDIREIDNPKTLASYYSQEGADEIVIYDIMASAEKRKINLSYISEIVSNINIPFSLGGGISEIWDIENCLKINAKKVSLNSAAIKNPYLVKEGALKFGSQSIVLSIDAKRNDKGSWSVYHAGGKIDTGLDAIQWAKKGVELGAGELVINSIDKDGMKSGYDIELLKKIKGSVSVPIIASGGAGRLEDFYNVIKSAKIDGVLAASVFHYGEIKIKELKDYLKGKGVAVKN